MPNRETVFDEALIPLLSQIYDICEQHDIPFVATFELDPAETGVLVMGTSMLLPAHTRSVDLREFGELMDPSEPTAAEGAVAPVIPIRRER